MADELRDFEFYDEVHRFLVKQRTLSLATADADGQPHAANLNYCCDDDFCLYFISKPQSTHSQHLRRDGRVAVTIYVPVSQPLRIHGVQMRGRAEQLDDARDRKAALTRYKKRYPYARMPGFAKLIAEEEFYRITPAWVRWIDNRRSFGFRAEQQIAPPAVSLPADRRG